MKGEGSGLGTWGPGPDTGSVSLCVESSWLQRVYLDPETVDLECERVM